MRLTMTFFLSMAFLLLASSISASSLKASPPSDDSICSTIIYDMVDCLSYLTEGSKDKKPTPSCCSGFKSVLDADANCVCEALKNSKSMGFDIDFKRAAALPSACGVSASISKCGVLSPPGGVPSQSPSGNPPPSHGTPPPPPPSHGTPPPSHSTPRAPTPNNPSSGKTPAKSPPAQVPSAAGISPTEGPGTSATSPSPSSSGGSSSSASSSDTPSSILSGFLVLVCMASLSFMSI